MSILTAPEAEKGVLASIFWDNRNESMDKVSRLEPHHFSVRTHGIIFDACRKLYLDGKPVDVITLNEKLRSMGKLEEIGGEFAFKPILDYIATPAHIDYYANEVLEKSRLFRLNDIAEKIRRSSEVCENVSGFISEIESDIYSLQEDNSQTNLKDKAADNLEIQIQKRLSGQTVFGLQSGIHSFDKFFGGFQEGQYYVIGGRPSTGKSAFADQVTCNLIERGVPVLYIALEGSTDRCYAKFASKRAGLVFTDYQLGKMSKEQYSLLSDIGKKIKKEPLVLMRPANISSTEIRSIIRRESRNNKIGLVVLDYIQKVKVPANMDERRGIAEASKQIQQACVDTGVPSLIVVQLNRESLNERPKMSHIKETGQIEQDADNIMLMFPDDECEQAPESKLAPVIMSIEKNKDGMNGLEVKLLFDKPKMKFLERAKEIRNYND